VILSPSSFDPISTLYAYIAHEKWKKTVKHYYQQQDEISYLQFRRIEIIADPVSLFL
jgi:hypothetical protein